MYPLCRREHKTLGQRSPATNVPMILQSYSWREAIASNLFPKSGQFQLRYGNTTASDWERAALSAKTPPRFWIAERKSTRLSALIL